MHPARRALITLLVAITLFGALAGTGAAQDIGGNAIVCVRDADAHAARLTQARTDHARAFVYQAPQAQTDDVMIVVDLTFGDVY